MFHSHNWRIPDDASRFRVLGLDLSIVAPTRALALIQSWALDRRGRYICLRDVASLMACRADSGLTEVNNSADLVCPDGMPLALIGRARGHDVERTCGPDLFDLVCKGGGGLRHYFYGGKEGVAERLAEVCRRRYPGIDIVGVECPPFRPKTMAENEATIDRIRASGADVVWVGMSSPKQDVWMNENVGRLTQTLIGVGAAFDFHSGEVARAPLWMQRSGLEWMHRLGSEPGRLWRRYLVLAPKFVALALYHREWRRPLRDSTKPTSTDPSVL